MNQKNSSKTSSSPIIGLPLQGQPQVQGPTATTEAFVRRIVVEVFGQRISQASVTAIAKRILAVLP